MPRARQGRPRLGRGQAREGDGKEVEIVHELGVVKTPPAPQQQLLVSVEMFIPDKEQEV